MQFIAAHMSYLWLQGRFRIVSGQASGGLEGAYLIVESDLLRLTSTSDRGDLFLELDPVEVERPKDGFGFSIDLVRRLLLLASREPSAVLDPSMARFLGDNLTQIENLYSSPNWPTTIAELRKLRADRSKETWA